MAREDGYVDGLIYWQIDLMMYGVNGDGEGGGWICAWCIGLMYGQMDEQEECWSHDVVEGGWMDRLVDGFVDLYIY